jgi:hypothetical protein
VLRHPAFATIGFSSMHGNTQDLFGANVRASDTIMVRINRAHMESGAVDRVYDDGPIVEAEMTQAQFAQAISQFNRGSGTPVTLRLAPPAEAPIAVYPAIAPVDIVERLKTKGDDRVEAELKKITEAFEQVRAICDGDGTVPKKQLKEAVRHLGILFENLPRNLRYYGDLLREDVDKLVNEAQMQLHAEALRIEGDRAARQLFLATSRNAADEAK